MEGIRVGITASETQNEATYDLERKCVRLLYIL